MYLFCLSQVGTATVIVLVAAALAGADKHPGPQLHHITGQDGFDTFGKTVAHVPAYGGPQHDIGISSGGYSGGGGLGASGGGHSGGYGYGGGGGYPPPESLTYSTSYQTQYVPVLQPIHSGGGGGGKKAKGKGGPFSQFNKMLEDAGKKLSKFGKYLKLFVLGQSFFVSLSIYPPSACTLLPVPFP